MSIISFSVRKSCIHLTKDQGSPARRSALKLKNSLRQALRSPVNRQKNPTRSCIVWSILIKWYRKGFGGTNNRMCFLSLATKRYLTLRYVQDTCHTEQCTFIVRNISLPLSLDALCRFWQCELSCTTHMTSNLHPFFLKTFSQCVPNVNDLSYTASAQTLIRLCLEGTEPFQTPKQFRVQKTFFFVS